MTASETLASIALIGLLLGGCGNICNRMCDAQADLMEGCFDTWESSWQGQSYENREAFIARCDSLWAGALEALEEDSVESQEFEESCRVQMELALADSDCESLLLIDP